MAKQPTFAVHVSLTVSPKSVHLNLAERLLVYVIFAKIKNRVLGRRGRPTQRVLMGINVDMVES